MEATCPRCHQTLNVGGTYCPSCGLPQLVYNTENSEAEGIADRWNDAVRDASMVAWRPAMRTAALLAVPAGLLSSGISPVSGFGIFWMAAAAAWAVVLYVRKGSGPPWVTAGAGARIGLITGIIAAWLCFSISGARLYVERYQLNHGAQLDDEYKGYITQSFQSATQQSASQMSGSDVAQAQAMFTAMEAFFLSPWGRAGSIVMSLLAYSTFLLTFAIGGGVIGARLLVRMHRRQS